MGAGEPRSRPHRRHVLRWTGAAGLAALAAPAVAPLGAALAARDAGGHPVPGYGPLARDPAGRLDLPHGFAYHVLSRAGDAMDDGLRVPGLADGMHAFDGGDGRTVLVRNHELDVGARDHAFAGLGELPRRAVHRVYDPRVGAGGVTTVVLDGGGLRVRRQFLSLAGTLRNCAGGATPWGSWVSCEESVVARGERGAARDHGYAFEVPASARALTAAVPLKAMGRFVREAVAVDPATGIVYQTEDRVDGLLYRFVPQVPGRLAAGGRLEALSIRGLEGAGTSNRPRETVPGRRRMAVRWVALDDVRAPRDDLRERGRAAGACAFRRGEGMAVEVHGQGTRIWFVCTDAGPRRHGQLWCYRPSTAEGGSREATDPGTLELFLEPGDASVMHRGDNLTLTPGGDVLVCEDHGGMQRVVGVTGDGGVYPLARNPRGDAEFAGATFGPDGRVLYLNLQQSGLTVAITGPWARRRV